MNWLSALGGEGIGGGGGGRLHFHGWKHLEKVTMGCSSKQDPLGNPRILP